MGNLKVRTRPKESASQLLSAAMSLWGLTDIESFWDPQLETKTLLGWNQDQIVLAFRGTASFANALSDLKVRRVCVSRTCAPGWRWGVSDRHLRPEACYPATGSFPLQNFRDLHHIGWVCQSSWSGRI